MKQMTFTKYLPLATLIALVPGLAAAQDAEFASAAETAFIFNTLLFLSLIHISEPTRPY